MFDEIVKRNFNNTIIEYGLINGNNTILLIKTGSEGTIYGYKNKYLELAKYVSSIYGFTVIVSSNPRTGINSNQLADAIKFIDSLPLYRWQGVLIDTFLFLSFYICAQMW